MPGYEDTEIVDLDTVDFNLMECNKCELILR